MQRSRILTVIRTFLTFRIRCIAHYVDIINDVNQSCSEVQGAIVNQFFI
jgi:hypothetical protein